MKKEYIIGIIATIIIVLLSIFAIIFYINKNYTSDLETETKTKLAERMLEENKEESYNVDMVSTSSTQEKTSPMAIFIFKTKYNDCNHTIVNRLEIPKEFVNKTEEEIKKEYNDWKVEQFSSNEVVFFCEKSGICEEHYILRDKDGYLAIYTVDSYGNETLKNMTQIVTAYLPETDIMRLKEGIKVVGKEELNATLEDYE